VSPTVVIDSFPEAARVYRNGYGIVALDVIRATTTAVTACAGGRRVYPVPSLEAAVPLAARLDRPLLVGELGGNMPYGFDLQNSPALVAQLSDDRPLILLSTAGTRLVHEAVGAEGIYIGCLRNLSATARLLVERHERVALIGAGTRGVFREEDQIGCAWLAERLIAAGFEPADSRTGDLVERWHDAPVETIRRSDSAEYLLRSGQIADLEFVLDHVDDIDSAYELRDDEIVAAA
jgi:2-phosphosulfolactate phosphatase